MKFLLRSLLVLAVAAAFGVLLYYSVQALPGSSSSPPAGARLQPEGGRSDTSRAATLPEHTENSGRKSLRWRSLLQVARRIVLFSALVLISVFGKNILFGRKTGKRNTAD